MTPVLVMLGPEGPRLADATAPQLTVTDQGATRGDGLFETALAVADASGTLEVRKAAAHLGRLASSAAALDLPVPGPRDWTAAMDLGLAAWADAHVPAPGDRVTVRLTATRGPEGSRDATPTPTCWVLLTAAPAPDPRERAVGVRVLLLDRGLDSRVAERAPWLLTGAKTLSYAVNMAALRHARAHGADDVIFTSADGHLLEGPTSTVLIVPRDGAPDADGGAAAPRLITPLRQKGILAGTSQAVVFAAAEAEGWRLGYGPLTPADLEDVAGVWLVSSVRGVVPVRSVDGRALPVDADLTARLQAWLDADGDPGPHVSGDPVPDAGGAQRIG